MKAGACVTSSKIAIARTSGVNLNDPVVAHVGNSEAFVFHTSVKVCRPLR